ncbi:ATP synthase F1 subunit gamma [Candidatus Roizmanbacteria bacterium]|nr:ATP synthase F1 subunit gamma [Candidatus Roizmanbacteria bacterium]
MAGVRKLVKRIKSAKNIAQITKAMQMVAASRMRRAQDAARAGKPYQEKIMEAVTALSTTIEQGSHELLRPGNDSGKILLVLIATNKGLCGGLNTTLFRQVIRWFPNQPQIDFITLGKKAQQFAVRSKASLLADFSSDDFLGKAQAVTELFVQNFLKGTYKEVYIVFNEFISSLNQEPVMRRILPVELIRSPGHTQTEVQIESGDMLIEPSPDRVLNALLPHYIEVQLRTAILEALASEHSARMIAMKNATDNARGLIDDLTLAYNRARQEKITYEIADIVTARISME